MSRVKLDLRTKNDLTLLKLARDHRDAMFQNPNFLNPTPAAVELEEAIQSFANKLDLISAAETSLQVLRAQKEQLRKSLEGDLTDRARYVDIESKGVEAVILTSAFQIYATPTPTTHIDMPTAVVATMGSYEGEVMVSFSPVARAKSYIGEVREHSENEVPGHWHDAKVVTRSSMKFSGLVPGKKYAFRVRALGPNELESPWSGEVVCMAP